MAERGRKIGFVSLYVEGALHQDIRGIHIFLSKLIRLYKDMSDNDYGGRRRRRRRERPPSSDSDSSCDSTISRRIDARWERREEKRMRRDVRRWRNMGTLEKLSLDDEERERFHYLDIAFSREGPDPDDLAVPGPSSVSSTVDFATEGGE
ncbi:hypothetical protein RF55_17228 [Lasius niger]|uniref:Uncharacterized protein n=1 Tax=Lasius niger TaxID=67767 RepID=A0A0J7K2R9_LASNI|nr:hypothetical protein RF55_17228 [Lasius niger]